MAKRRRLGDLFIVGKSVVFDDGQGEPIEVFVRKLTPLDQEAALKAANAKRAVAISRLKDVGSPDHAVLVGEVDALSRDELVRVLTQTKLANRVSEIEAEIEGEEEWQESGLLEGLTTAWEDDGLKEVYFKGEPEDGNPDAYSDYLEAKRVHDKMQEFSEAVDEAVKLAEEDLDDLHERMSFEDLQDEVKELHIGSISNSDWFAEYRRQELFYAVRDPRTQERYFTNRAEVDALSLEVIGTLVREYKSLEVDPIEGKG